eukprot:scpid23103/ scgid30094/ 
MASSDPAAPSGNGVPDVATLLQLLTTQAQASAQLDLQFQTLMERMDANQPSSSAPVADKCLSCGRSPHTLSTCPAQSRKRNGCQRVGHFQSMCPHKGKPTASGKVGQLKLQRASVRHGLELSVHTQLNTEPTAEAMTWIPDTGSDVDAIGPAHLSQLGGFPENLAVDSDTVSAANGTSLVSLGKISATLSIGSAQHTTVLHVYEDLDEALLSCQSLRALGILPESWPRISRVKSEPSSADIADVKAQLMQEFADVFDDSQLKPMAGPPMEIKLQFNRRTNPC